MAIGAAIGKVLASRVPERWARRLVVALAQVSGASTMVKGLRGL
jgi:uncharacterized membrane protein YfcA